MNLGAFSISLNVKDLMASKEFYETLGFKEFAGSQEMNYFIMKNGDALIGLFHGMFEGNIITFNPGWDQSANTLNDFMPVREIQKNIQSKKINLMSEAEGDSGPGNFMLADPDGNLILVDQHVS